MNGAGMKYPTTLIIAALFCSTAAAAQESTTCNSPCYCHDAYGEGRWSVKTDASLPPTDASAIQAVTPSEMFSWPSPDAPSASFGGKSVSTFAHAKTLRRVIRHHP